ncbi:protein spaetzle isoform X2 [Episyrphus balteatus]|uniref:protein spaetzle isoform X2 n=1 Tax=Episyrphus balteatus TaxID=286459 RepID=UPI0024860B6E|nr:protein spaetzle isoform X2 [Episyrphus balteatus]
MFSITKLLVLLIICETTVCQNDYSFTRARFRRETRNQNASEGTDSETQTTKADVDEIIPKIFSVNNSGLVLFNMTNTPTDPNEPQQDQPFNEKQDFKKSSMPQRSNTPSAERTSNTAAQRRHPPKDFFFPDEIDSEPKCQEEGKSFCTDVQNYPEHKVEDMLKNQISKFDVLFGDDDIPQPLNISQRMSPGEDSLCKSVERVIYPKAGESKDLKWLYIVNQQNYTQAVKIEECVNPESACMFADSFPNGYVTMCKQSFIYRQLVAFTKNGEIVKDNFKLPSCCKCIYKQR